MKKALWVFLFSGIMAASSYGAITVSSYSSSPAPSGSYPDSGGVELTDGITNSVAWGSGVNISYSDVGALSGWLNTNPSITFNFAEPVTVRSFTVWAADSDGHAGVGLPSSITLRTPSSSFSQTFTVTDPAGNGYTVPLSFSGFSVTSDQLIVESTRAQQWTMFSEVQFSAVPEPTYTALAFGVLCLFLFRKRLRK